MAGGDRNVLDLVDCIYASVLDEGQWHKMLLGLGALTGCATAALKSFEIAESGSIQVRVESDQGRLTDAVEDLAEMMCADPTERLAAEHLMRSPTLAVVRDTDVWPNTREYRKLPAVDGMLTNGLFHRSAIVLNAAPGRLDMLGLVYSDGREPMTAMEEAKLRPALCHLQRAITYRRPFDLLRQRYNAVVSALDNLRAGVVLTDARGRIVVANRQASTVLDAKDGLTRTPGGTLRAASESESASLFRLIDSAITRSRANLNGMGGRMVVTHRSGRPPLILEISPLRGDAEVGSRLRGAIILILAPDETPGLTVAPLSTTYGLSAAEADVCRLVIEGRSNQEIAAERSVAPETVKFQVSRVFSKTRTRNRVELTRLAAIISPPFANSSD